MMTRIRIALGDVQSPMLRDILAQITSLQPDMELVGPVRRSSLADDLVAQKPHVVIADIRPEELPELCGELFAHAHPPVVVGLARDGREAAVCMANAGAAQLMSVVRGVIRDAVEHTGVLEMPRPAGVVAPSPYTSNAECLNDQLRSLDLALLAEVDRFESTLWDEGVQRLQGLAISPAEVRSLLQESASTEHRQTGELKWRRQRLEEWNAQRIKLTVGQPGSPPFVQLLELFRLDLFERFCITAALASEIDHNKYGKAFALLQDDVTRKQPSWELLLRLHGGGSDGERWQASHAFDGSQPLRRWNLLRLAPREPGDPATAFGRRVELDERIARYLLGLADLGPQLEELAAVGGWDSAVLQIEPDATTRRRLGELVADSLASGAALPRLVVHVHGPYGTGRRALIANVCDRHGLRLIRVDAARLVALPTTAFDETLLLLAREPLLHPAAVCLENVDMVLTGDGSHASALATAVEAVRSTAAVVFVLSQRPWLPETIVRGGAAHSIGLELPDAAEGRRLWATHLANDALDSGAGGVDTAARELAGRFALSAGQIRDAAAAARLRARLAGQVALTMADLYRGCRDQCSHRLALLARQVTTNFGWSDLIVPSTQANQLRELESTIRNASGVLQDWNFGARLPYGRGITALFSGPSGTGKTMAAGILARELGLDLYQIDLSRVVSKYIGETEKNLDHIFEEAEASNAMLFFDEADALFGKRSTIKDAHDRYANIEVSYLLQKMEVRNGVTILATNLRANIDDAFLRRIRVVIDFPTPEQHQRQQIWRGSLPKEARLAPDVDLATLAKRYRLTGGSIVNICLNAASLAYAPDGTIEMKHLLHATKRELQKIGEQYREEDFSPELTVVVGGRGRNGA